MNTHLLSFLIPSNTSYFYNDRWRLLDHPVASHSVLKFDGINFKIIMNFCKAIGKYSALYLFLVSQNSKTSPTKLNVD